MCDPFTSLIPDVRALIRRFLPREDRLSLAETCSLARREDRDTGALFFRYSKMLSCLRKYDSLGTRWNCSSHLGDSNTSQLLGKKMITFNGNEFECDASWRRDEFYIIERHLRFNVEHRMRLKGLNWYSVFYPNEDWQFCEIHWTKKFYNLYRSPLVDFSSMHLTPRVMREFYPLLFAAYWEEIMDAGNSHFRDGESGADSPGD